jgi:purine nucleosidase
MKRIILDTDIGTDVDDAVARTLAAASPELQIEGVTTVHAHPPFLAGIARKLQALLAREMVEVIAGASHPLKMPHRDEFR